MRKRAELSLLRPWYDDLNCRSIIGTWLGVATLAVWFTWSWSIFVVICLIAIWTGAATAYWKFVRRWEAKQAIEAIDAITIRH